MHACVRSDSHIMANRLYIHWFICSSQKTIFLFIGDGQEGCAFQDLTVGSDGAKDQHPNHCYSCHILPFPSQLLADMTISNAHLKLHNVKGVNKRRKNVFRAATQLWRSQHESMVSLKLFIVVCIALAPPPPPPPTGGLVSLLSIRTSIWKYAH